MPCGPELYPLGEAHAELLFIRVRRRGWVGGGGGGRGGLEGRGGTILCVRKALVFGRRFHFERVRRVAEGLFPGAEIVLASDERTGGREVLWWGKEFYRAYREKSNPSLSEADLDEIKARCRWLRLLPQEKAHAIGRAGFLAWDRILQEVQPDVVLLLDVDSVPLDTLARAADRLGVPNVAPILSTYGGRIRFTQRGELRGEMPESLLDRTDFERIVAEMAQPLYRPGWLAGTTRSHAATARRRLLVDTPKPFAYAFYRLLAVDPLSFSFCTPDRRTMLIATPDRYRVALQTEERAKRPLPSEFALLPLQFYPESTSDYFVPELEMINHHEVTLAIAERLRGKMPVVVKEHPYVFGRRSPDVLRRLLADDNVWFAPLLMPIGELIMQAQLIVGYHSSTMLQAMPHGRRLLFAGTPYYGDAGHPVLTERTPEAIDEGIEAAMRYGPTPPDRARDVFWRLYRATAKASLGQYAPLLEKTVSDAGRPEIDEATRALLASALRREAQSAGDPHPTLSVGKGEGFEP